MPQPNLEGAEIAVASLIRQRMDGQPPSFQVRASSFQQVVMGVPFWSRVMMFLRPHFSPLFDDWQIDTHVGRSRRPDGRLALEVRHLHVPQVCEPLRRRGPVHDMCAGMRGRPPRSSCFGPPECRCSGLRRVSFPVPWPYYMCLQKPTLFCTRGRGNMGVHRPRGGRNFGLGLDVSSRQRFFPKVKPNTVSTAVECDIWCPDFLSRFLIACFNYVGLSPCVGGVVLDLGAVRRKHALEVAQIGPTQTGIEAHRRYIVDASAIPAPPLSGSSTTISPPPFAGGAEKIKDNTQNSFSAGIRLVVCCAAIGGL